MATPHVHYFVVCVPELKTQGLKRDATTWDVVQNMTRMLMSEYRTITTINCYACDARSTAGWAQHFVICESGRMQVNTMIGPQIESSSVVIVAKIVSQRY